jgi:hypothetical protein
LRCDGDNGEAIMAPEALSQSCQHDLYWRSQLRKQVYNASEFFLA